MDIDIFLLEFDSKVIKGKKIRYASYVGNPYYVTGNAILHSVCSKLSMKEKQKIKVSHGMFVNIFPEFRYRNEKGQHISHKIPEMSTYHDFFKFRLPLFPYSDLDITNIPDMYASHIKNDKIMIQKRSYLIFYTVGLDNPEVFDGIQLGGRRNLGFGETRIQDHKQITFEDLNFDRILDKDELWIELITPLCVKSDFVNTKHYTELPSFIEHDGSRIRYREEYIKQERNEYNLKLIDHGQAFKYKGGVFKDKKEIIYTVKQGLTGIYNHAKYGYGEFMMR